MGCSVPTNRQISVRWIRHCEAPSCSNSTANCTLTFFKVPSDNERRQEWLSRIGQLKSDKKSIFLCSDHFCMESFTDTLKRRLHKKVIPLFATELGESCIERMSITHTAERVMKAPNSVVKVKEEPADSYPDETSEPQEISSCCKSEVSDSSIDNQKESLIKIKSSQGNNALVKEPDNSNCDKAVSLNSQSQIISPANKRKEEPLSKLNCQVKNVQVTLPDNTNHEEPFSLKSQSQTVSLSNRRMPVYHIAQREMSTQFIRRCAAFSCTNTTANCRHTFFKVPSDIKRRQEWLNRVGQLKPVGKSIFLCSDHFSMKSFTDTFKRRLHRKVLPVFITEHPERCTERTSVTHTSERDMIASESDVKVKEPDTSYCDKPFTFNSQSQTVSPSNRNKNFASSSNNKVEPLNKLRKSPVKNVQITVNPDSSTHKPLVIISKSQAVLPDKKSKESNSCINNAKSSIKMQISERNSILQKREMSDLNNEFSKKKSCISVSNPQLPVLSNSSARNSRAEPLSEMNGKEPKASKAETKVTPTKRCVVAELIVCSAAKSKQKSQFLSKNFYS